MLTSFVPTPATPSRVGTRTHKSLRVDVKVCRLVHFNVTAPDSYDSSTVAIPRHRPDQGVVPHDKPVVHWNLHPAPTRADSGYFKKGERGASWLHRHGLERPRTQIAVPRQSKRRVPKSSGHVLGEYENGGTRVCVRHTSTTCAVLIPVVA